jgi:hypothetical protein
MVLGLAPVWAYRYFPTQDGPSHLLNARVFDQCADQKAPEAEFYERRWSPIPNWTAAAVLDLLAAVLPPFTAEKALVSIYLIGLPLAVDYFLTAMDAAGASALGLLFLWNSCLLRGFYSYGLGMALLFLTLGWFLRRPSALDAGDTARLSGLLLASYFTHLAAFLIAVFCLLWFAAARSGPRARTFSSILIAAMPGSLLTLNYFSTTGFFGAPEASSALDIAREEMRGTLTRVWEAPAVLFRELFTTDSSFWLPGLVVLTAALWLWDRRDEGGADSARLPRPVLGLSLALFVLLALIPDTLRAHGGFLKARLAPIVPLFALGALRSAARGPVRLGHSLGLILVIANLALVTGRFAKMDREVEEFTTGITWVHAGETLVSVKAPSETTAIVDPFFSEYYCIATHAICLSSYEGGTEHFPVRLRRGVKHRIRQNKPGSFWADVVLGWGAAGEALPQADEPYVEVFRRGKLRLFRRVESRRAAPLAPPSSRPGS